MLNRQLVFGALIGGAEAVAATSPVLRGHVCNVSRNTGAPFNVTTNDVTFVGGTHICGSQARQATEAEAKMATNTGPSRGVGQRVLGLGLLDLLAGPPGVDGYLEQIRPTWVVRQCRAEVTGIRHQTPDSVTLRLRANRAWEGFRAGQFLRLAVEVDGVRRTRCYSPASAAGTDRELELTVKAHPEGSVSNFLIESAARGMVVGLERAEGDFHLPDPRPERILLISGGSGITPVMSMLRTLCAESYHGSITFLHFAPDPERAIYRDELERIAAARPNVRLVRSYTRAPGMGEVDGHFHAAQLAQCEPEYGRAETFACGPPALLDSVREMWASEGIESHLHVESFVPPMPVAIERRSRGLHPFRRLRPAARQQRCVAAPAGRGRRTDARDGLSDGHLSHLHLSQARRHGQEPRHGRALLG